MTMLSTDPASQGPTESKTVWINTTRPAADPARPPIRELREVLPLRLHFGRPDGTGTGQADGQWCLMALDLATGAERSFTMESIERWATRSPQWQGEGEQPS